MTQPVFRRRGQALYFLQFASQVFVWPFLPLWLRRHVDGPLRLGSLLGACRAAQLAAAPAVTYAVEQAPRWLVLLGCWVASQLATVGLVAAANLRVGGFAALCALALARACAEAPITPMVDAIVVKATRDFSNARLWGAVAWGGLGPTAGLVFEFFGFTANVAAFGGLSAVAALLFFHLDAKMEPDDDLDDDIAQQSPQRGGATIEMRRSQKKATTKKRRPDLFPNPFKRAARLRKYESVPDLDDESDDEEEEVVEEPDEGGFARFENPFRRFNNRRRDDDDDEDEEGEKTTQAARGVMMSASCGRPPTPRPRREKKGERGSRQHRRRRRRLGCPERRRKEEIIQYSVEFAVLGVDDGGLDGVVDGGGDVVYCLHAERVFLLAGTDLGSGAWSAAGEDAGEQAAGGEEAEAEEAEGEPGEGARGEERDEGEGGAAEDVFEAAAEGLVGAGVDLDRGREGLLGLDRVPHVLLQLLGVDFVEHVELLVDGVVGHAREHGI
mmetsp:Transcript_29189/g.89285  ORF Transcript_29189/g.89285 Transcript_29189/m.89285 type:complete len:498 (-) Transcript_29189:1056-2549(-)